MLLELDPRGAAVDALFAATAIFTEREVVRALLARINWPARPGRLVDPSCGDGAFLLGALEMMDFKPGDRKTVDRVAGWEIHPWAVSEARDNVARYLMRRGWSDSEAEACARSMVRETDFLCQPPEHGAFSIIAGNPPYLRAANLPAYFREVYAGVVPEYARGDILHAFLDRCASLLPSDGVIALVTSDRWLMNLTTGELRAKIGQRLGITHLARLDVSTAFYRPKRRIKGSLPRIHPIEVVLESAGGRELTMAAVPMDAARPDSSVRLDEIATVSLAPWLGGDGVFLVDRATAGRLIGAELVPAVDAGDIPADRDILGTPTRFAIRTVRDREPDGELKAHILRRFSTMPAKCQERFRKTGVYWMPAESIRLPLNGSRLMVPRIARRIRVVDLPEGVLPLDHNFQIAPLNSATPITLLRAILVSPESQTWLALNAARLENGFYMITTELLRRLPVPDRFIAGLGREGA